MDEYSKLKRALEISNRSPMRQWDKAGAPGQIPGYATHVNATSRAAKYMSTGSYIGIGIGEVNRPLLQTFSRLAINLLTFPFIHGYHKHSNFLVNHLIDQAVTAAT
ncbi:hypothetical protein EMIT0196MI5_140060 [Pseudomonas sp. IT-196MI5]